MTSHKQPPEKQKKTLPKARNLEERGMTLTERGEGEVFLALGQSYSVFSESGIGLAKMLAKAEKKNLLLGEAYHLFRSFLGFIGSLGF